MEALESLAHTAALFLAEFMDSRKGQAGEQRVDPGAGSAYAAAAAGWAAELFRPSEGERGSSGWGGGRDVVEEEEEEQSGRLTDSEDSPTDGGGDEDTPARAGPGDAGDGGDHTEEVRSEVLGSPEGPKSDHEELDVKIEQE